MLSSRIEICSWDLKLQWQISVNDERQVSRVEFKIFTRFVFKLAFRVSESSMSWDKPPTSKGRGAYNLHAIFKCL